MNTLDTSSSLYDVLVRPVMDCLRKDIESYTQYARDIEQDLTRITFTSGPRLEASIIEQDLDAVKRLYREYSASRIAVLELSPPPSMKRLPDEGTVVCCSSACVDQVTRHRTPKDCGKTSSETESRPHTFRNILSKALE
ncbi:hypothetical protein FRC18_004687 [Serendipita sp. 400]|nr:hypothetical protein FRC18_004687 [Serendipita sp. 400]